MDTSRAWGLVCVSVGLLSNTALALNMETVPVGDPGNPADNHYRICGSVGAAYRIGTYEVTAGQYTEFLNAVAKTDTYGLYNTLMWSAAYSCQIERTGSSGGYSYSVAPGYANRPVNFVSYWNACRFTNWLQNGQPTGEQGAGTTETGAYTLNGYNGDDGRTIERNANWKWALPTEDEWYKAAYYKGGSTDAGYWDYPTASTSINGHMANYSGSVTHPSDVGSFPYPSPYGTFDQGGNVWEWNETMVFQDSAHSWRGLRGGAFGSSEGALLAVGYSAAYPTYVQNDRGFRVVQVPEPASLVLLVLGGLVVMRRTRKGVRHKKRCQDDLTRKGVRMIYLTNHSDAVLFSLSSPLVSCSILQM